MTYKEKLMKESPENVRDLFAGGCVGCPDDYGYEEYTPCFCDCEYCWNRECDK